MKTKVKVTHNIKDFSEYPVIKIHKDCLKDYLESKETEPYIVRFISRNTGIQLSGPYHEYLFNLSDCWDESEFVIFNGEVSFSNNV